ncbi:MAG: polysaccharide biosynthesis protein [Gemmataceae bacterium]|nr:polysaccharide biosynthesis protein [Gemmataceae bacterium]
MTRSPVIIRVDANPQLGYEHMTRCLTVAAALQRRRRQAFFLSSFEPGSLGFQVKRAGYEWIEASSPIGSPEDLAEVAEEARRIQASAILVDSPNVDGKYISQLGKAGVMVVAIDHMAQKDFKADLVYNPLLGPPVEAYHLAKGTQILTGERYALVRPEIRRVRPLRAQEPPPPFRAIVALGDSDPNNQAGEIALQLINAPKVSRVDILARSYYSNLEELKALAERSDGKIGLFTEPSEMPPRLSRCHLAVTAGNSWSLEIACIGVPQLIIVQKECHWHTASRLEEEGAATIVGAFDRFSPQALRDAAVDLLDDALERQAMSRNGRKLIDGRGNDRIVTAFEIMQQPFRQEQLKKVA